MLWFRAAQPTLIGAFLLLLLGDIFLVGYDFCQWGFDRCSYCDGEGFVLMSPLGGPFHGVECDECSFMGRFKRLHFSFRRREDTIILGTWLFLGAVFLYGTACAFRVIDCRDCVSRGCRRCGGKGWLTAVDRWVAER